MNRYMKADITQIKSRIAQNVTLAVDNDGRPKHGLMEFEKQVTQNGAATPELRADLQAAFGAVAQHPSLASATGAAPAGASEMHRYAPNSKSLATGPSMTSRRSKPAATKSCNEQKHL